MVDLTQYRPSALPTDDGPLARLRISSAPVQVVIPSTMAAEASIHWVDDVGIRGPVHCPGARCPICHLDDPAKDYLLVPAIEIGSLRAHVIVVSKVVGPRGILSQILPHLAGNDLTQKYFSLRKEANGFEFRVDVNPICTPPTGLDDVIAAYRSREEQEGEALLTSAVEAWSAQDLSMLQGYQRLLEMRGDWSPPAPPSKVEQGG